MGFSLIRGAVLLLALGPLVYYALSLVVAASFFRQRHVAPPPDPAYAPPASILKPVRGLDPDAYENFASFCRIDYPEYEVLFCVSEADDPVVPVIEKLRRDFPERKIRLVIGAPEIGASSKVNKLCRIGREARHDLLVISDSDVRVGPRYLWDVAAPFADPQVGAVTAFFRSALSGSGSFGATLDAAGAAVEFATNAVLARRLEGIKFTLGATMATTRARLAEIGGFESLADHHADDYELGNRIAARGYRVELALHPVWLIYPPESLGQFLRHELRWTIGLRNVRPSGHAAMVFTFGLPWTLLVAAAAPAGTVTLAYVFAYLVLRYAVYGVVGIWGLDDPVVRRSWWLAPLRDAANFGVWLASFFSNKIHWRGREFQVKKGILLPVNPSPAVSPPVAPAKDAGARN